MSLGFVDYLFHKEPKPETVKYVDVDRYCAHPWYEIERIPYYYERGLRNVVAQYSKLPDGTLQVLNQGVNEYGEIKQSIGTATADDETNSKLHVTFFWPFSGEYWIVKLDDNYEYSVVSDSDREYLWILSSTPKMNPKRLDEIHSWLGQNGYDVSKLETTIQG